MNNHKVKYWGGVAIAILFWPVVFIGCYFLNATKEPKKHITPRDMKGIDTIRVMDSLYIIKFTIEKAIPDTVDNLSQDKYDVSY